ncbi:hypothetical protein HDV03_002535 [Kappamyces sp. JEL0829]|nr:hypothetical protein HDV03_002535 [Kappamyces sp. JEL0829]
MLLVHDRIPFRLHHPQVMRSPDNASLSCVSVSSRFFKLAPPGMAVEPLSPFQALVAKEPDSFLLDDGEVFRQTLVDLFSQVRNENFYYFLSLTSHHRVLKVLERMENARACCWLDSAEFAIALTSGDVVFYRLDSGETVREQGRIQQPHSDYVFSIVYAKARRLLLIGSCDGGVSLWSLQASGSTVTASLSGTLSAANHVIPAALSFSPDASMVAFCKSNKVHVAHIAAVKYSTTSLTLDPLFGSCILWQDHCTFRLYSCTAHCLKLRVVGGALHLLADETASLNGVLSNAYSQSVLKTDPRDASKEDDDEISAVALAGVETSSFRVFGVVPSFHALQDIVLFSTGPTSTTPYQSSGMIPFYLACSPQATATLEEACALFGRDLESAESILDTVPAQLFWDLLAGSPEEILQKVSSFETIIQTRLAFFSSQGAVSTNPGVLDRHVLIKLRQLLGYLLECTSTLWQSTDAANVMAETRNANRDSIFALVMDQVLAAVVTSSSVWTEPDLNILSRFVACHAEREQWTERVTATLDSQSRTTWRAIHDRNGLGTCKACESSIPLVSLFTSDCSGGHSWPRCGLSLQILDTINVLTCSLCSLKQMRVEHEGPIAAILAAVQKCIYCGSRMKCPSFRLRR